MNNWVKASIPLAIVGVFCLIFGWVIWEVNRPTKFLGSNYTGYEQCLYKSAWIRQLRRGAVESDIPDLFRRDDEPKRVGGNEYDCGFSLPPVVAFVLGGALMLATLSLLIVGKSTASAKP